MRSGSTLTRTERNRLRAAKPSRRAARRDRHDEGLHAIGICPADQSGEMSSALDHVDGIPVDSQAAKGLSRK
jgi:hypothetical protein